MQGLGRLLAKAILNGTSVFKGSLPLKTRSWDKKLGRVAAYCWKQDAGLHRLCKNRSGSSLLHSWHWRRGCHEKCIHRNPRCWPFFPSPSFSLSFEGVWQPPLVHQPPSPPNMQPPPIPACLPDPFQQHLLLFIGRASDSQLSPPDRARNFYSKQQVGWKIEKEKKNLRWISCQTLLPLPPFLGNAALTSVCFGYPLNFHAVIES